MVLLVAGCTSHGTPSSTGGMDIHFCEISDCDDVFTDYMIGASDIACAFYDVGNEDVAAVLLDNEARLVMDAHDPLPGAVTPNHEGLMHHKFCVINRTVVITGSHNPGQGSDYNNMVLLYSEPIAERYLDIHRSLASGKKPGGHERFRHDGNLIEVYACPYDDCREELLQELEAADESIAFALFTFTDRDVARVLSSNHDDGVEVWGVVESFQARRYNRYYDLERAGIPVLLEDSPTLQHNKVFVIDNRTVITGSYNPTLSAATRNDENILIMHDSRVATLYTAALRRIYKNTQNFK